MNLGQIKTKVIQIIREYSSNGSLIGAGDNADYLLSVNGFISDAQYEIADIRPVKKKINLSTPDETTNNYYKYNLPSDFKDIVSLKLDERPFNLYEVESNQLLIPKDYSGSLVLIYKKYPDILDKSTADSKELEIDLDLQMIIPYYAAGHVIIDENPDLAQFFLGEYEKKKGKITSRNSQKRVTQTRW